jgi:hypothetical protein
LPVSASEWNASASMALEPVIAAATNLATAISPFAARATRTVRVLSPEAGWVSAGPASVRRVPACLDGPMVDPRADAAPSGPSPGSPPEGGLDSVAVGEQMSDQFVELLGVWTEQLI